MEHQTVLLILFWFLTFMLSIECCKTKCDSPHSRVKQTSTTTQIVESMTITDDLSETTTKFNTELPTSESDFITTTTNNQYNNNNEDKIPTRLPGHSIDMSETYKNNRCLGLHEEVFCLNGGKCFNYTMLNDPAAVLFLSCECAEGFIGERCESKYWEGTYKLHDVPSKDKINTINHHIYERHHHKQQYKSNSSPSIYRTAQIHPVTVIIAAIVLIASFCTYRMLLR